jgi:hypothetical protein
MFGDVPLSAIGSRNLTDLQPGTCLPKTDDAPGVVPFAVLILLAGSARVSAPPGPRAICPNVLLGVFFIEGSAVVFHTRSHAPFLWGTVDPGRPGRLLGFGPASNPDPPIPGRADTALGFRPLSGFRIIAG